MLWSVDTLDWETEDVQKIVDTVMSSAEDGAVILMHDIFKTSVDAAEIIIPKLIKEGYDLVTVHELAETERNYYGTRHCLWCHVKQAGVKLLPVSCPLLSFIPTGCCEYIPFLPHSQSGSTHLLHLFS